MFPLNMVSFPREEVNLHIFEERYKQLINECWEEKKCFGIPAYIDKKLMNYGTEMSVVEISKVFKNGEMNIKSVGRRAFKLLNFHPNTPNKLYATADVEFIKNDYEIDEEIKDLLIEKLKLLFDRLNIKKNLKTFDSFEVAHYIGMTQREEFALLKIEAEKERQIEIIKHLDKIMPVIERAQQIKNRVSMNGHFKNFPKLDF